MYELDWHVVLNTWQVKIYTNMSTKEVLALEDTGFQLEQGKALSPNHGLSTITTFSLPWSQICVLTNPTAHPSFGFLKAISCNPTTPTIVPKNTWKSVGCMYTYYVVVIVAIPQPRSREIKSIISKEYTSYHITIGDISYCSCPHFTKMSFVALEKKGK